MCLAQGPQCSDAGEILKMFQYFLYLENVSCFKVCFVSAYIPFTIEANTMNPDQTAPLIAV